MTSSDDPLDLNRAWWDERAALHGHDGWYYDTEAFLAGRSAVSQRELDEIARAVGDLDGSDVLHLQCHVGLSTLSLARMGARVTGVDFSSVAIQRARENAASASLDARFVVADAQALPPDLAESFDLVFASYGVLMWIASIDAWMASAASAARPGGALVIVDGHPLSIVYPSGGNGEQTGSYGGGTAVDRIDRGDYAVADAATTNDRAVHYRWGLGDVVSAAIGAGFEVASLTEWLDEPGSGSGARMGDDDAPPMTLEVEGVRLPTTFALRARRRS
jgi:SAM-dependent methyltransferase